jgi:flagellar export protein FliJ
MSRAFRFRLDPLLGVRRFELRRRLALLGAAHRDLAEARAREAAAWREAQASERREAARLRTGLPAGAAITAHQAVEAWRLRAGFAARDVRRLEARAARLADDARAARVRAEGLERLRERALVAWRAARERALQRELDEIAALRRARQGARS